MPPAHERFSAIWAYPWDLIAEGLDASLGRIAEIGLQGISLAPSYHAGMLLLPHNPRQKVRFLEDGALYFRPRLGRFDGLVIQPRFSALLDERDLLAEICQAAERHGLEVVSWTVCTHNSYQGERHPDKAIQNAFGDPLIYGLCPSHPAVQDYLQALLEELSAYPLRTLQLESYGFLGFPHGYHHEKINLPLGPWGHALMGLCFCPACERAAREEGVDLLGARRAARGALETLFEGEARFPKAFSTDLLVNEMPVLGPYLQMRETIETRLVLRLAEAASVPLNLLEIGAGMVRPLAAHVPEVTACAYRVAPQEVAEATRAARAMLESGARLSIGLEACPHLSPTEENLVAKVRAAWEAGADSLYFYNYGLMPVKSLEWLRAALA